jgi:hypothetical protein
MRLFADATVECSNKLVAGLKEINDTTKQMKTEEMELELRIHEETMRYKQGPHSSRKCLARSD